MMAHLYWLMKIDL